MGLWVGHQRKKIFSVFSLYYWPSPQETRFIKISISPSPRQMHLLLGNTFYENYQLTIFSSWTTVNSLKRGGEHSERFILKRRNSRHQKVTFLGALRVLPFSCFLLIFHFSCFSHSGGLELVPISGADLWARDRRPSPPSQEKNTRDEWRRKKMKRCLYCTLKKIIVLRFECRTPKR